MPPSSRAEGSVSEAMQRVDTPSRQSTSRRRLDSECADKPRIIRSIQCENDADLLRHLILAGLAVKCFEDNGYAVTDAFGEI